MYGVLHSAEETSSSLLQALSEAVGQPLSLDAQGECALEFDGALDLVVAFRTEADLVSLRSPLAPEGQVPGREFLVDALTLNYTQVPPGCRIAIDPLSRRPMLVALLSSPALAPEAFVQAVADFIELVPQVRERLAPPRLQDQAHSLIGTGALA